VTIQSVDRELHIESAHIIRDLLAERATLIEALREEHGHDFGYVYPENCKTCALLASLE
jgi:hypothetical protein